MKFVINKNVIAFWMTCGSILGLSLTCACNAESIPRIQPEIKAEQSSSSRLEQALEGHLNHTLLVIHGQHLKVSVHNQHITVVMDAIALMDGDLGKTIRVKNPLNHKTFNARIIGFQEAELIS